MSRPCCCDIPRTSNGIMNYAGVLRACRHPMFSSTRTFALGQDKRRQRHARTHARTHNSILPWRSPALRRAADAIRARQHPKRLPNRAAAYAIRNEAMHGRQIDMGCLACFRNFPCQCDGWRSKMAVVKNIACHHHPHTSPLLMNMRTSATIPLVHTPQPNFALCTSPD